MPYSNWTFTGQLINPGSNKLAAKFSRPPALHLTKFYSVNVVAVGTSKSRQNELQTITNSTYTSDGVPVLLPPLRNVK
jgi:hypothetical protein